MWLTKGSYAADHLDARQSFCLSLSQVSGCESVNYGPLSSSDYSCTSCKTSTYFLSGSPPICTFRSVISHCDEYDASLDKCIKCKESFYLSSNGLECVANPVGIPNCRTHQENGVLCKFCETDYYTNSSGDVCEALTAEEKKDHCEGYDSAKQCSRCATGYLLKSDQTCVQITAEHCLTYVDETKCETCPNLYYLDPETTASPRSCLPVNISGCVTSSNNKCVLCDSNSKPSSDGSSCGLLSSIKTNCSGYNSDEKCIRCVTPYILDPESGACLIEESMEKFLDPNCLNFRLSPECNTCKAGFYFDKDRKCVECSIEGCHFCSRGGKRCNLCRTGYYMDQSGACQQNSNVVFDSFEVTDDLGSFETVFEFTWFVYFYFLIYLVFDKTLADQQ